MAREAKMLPTPDLRVTNNFRSTPSQSTVAAVSPQPSIPAQASPPVRPPTTSPNPTPMPGTGNRVGGEGRGGGIRQTTPDPDEVRRRRLAFLEKMKKE